MATCDHARNEAYYQQQLVSTCVWFAHDWLHVDTRLRAAEGASDLWADIVSERILSVMTNEIVVSLVM